MDTADARGPGCRRREFRGGVTRRFEPGWPAWKAGILPLDYACTARGAGAPTGRAGSSHLSLAAMALAGGERSRSATRSRTSPSQALGGTAARSAAEIPSRSSSRSSAALG